MAANATAIADYLAIRPDDVAATTLPLHYCYGLSVLNSHLVAGAALARVPAALRVPAAALLALGMFGLSYATDLANAHAASFIQMILENRFNLSKEAKDFLGARLAERDPAVPAQRELLAAQDDFLLALDQRRVRLACREMRVAAHASGADGVGKAAMSLLSICTYVV